MHASAVVRTTGENPYANEILVRGHRVAADEPADLGGGDGGPTPYELLLGALGACTSITLRMYAGRKGWDLRGVEVELTAERGEKGAKDSLRRVVRLEGDLDGEQRARLMDIAGKCPVHRVLEQGAEVETVAG